MITKQNAPARDPDLIEIEAIIVDHPAFGSLGDGRDFATCMVRSTGPIGQNPARRNDVWPMIVHRQAAIEILRAAMPGDLLELRGVPNAASLIIPRSSGRIDLLLPAA